MSIQDLITEAKDRRVGFYKAATASLSRGPSGGSAAGGPYMQGEASIASAFGDQVTAGAERQYRAARGGWQWAAMRPVAVRVADQPFRCGNKQIRKDSGQNAPSKFRRKVFECAPLFVQKQMSEGMDQDDSHPLLELFESPNPFMTGWAKVYCTALSMQITGKAFWWLENLQSDPNSPSSAQQMRLWYLPVSWVREISTETEPLAQFKVIPPGVTEDRAVIVPGADMLRFTYPDPADPLGQLSPMQTQARAINTDDEIQKSQFASMMNGARPGMILTAGRLEMPAGMGGGLGPRPILTPEQRAQLTSACRLAYAGAMHHMEPFIIDGMIENVQPWTLNPVDLDFPNGSSLTKERIFQGFGMNPIVAGQIEGANRASAYVAQANVDANVVNPLITQISQTMTMKLSPRFSGDGAGRKLYVWIDRAVAHDEEIEIQKTAQLLEGHAITKNELRERNGMAPMETGGDEIAAPPEPPLAPPGSTGPQRPGSGGQRPPARGKPKR
jgi:phage portal protein BeeE